MIFIRADANDNIGTGHVTRCLSIAYHIRKLNEGLCFVTADDKSKGLIEEQGYSVICLHSQWNDLNQEIEVLCDSLITSCVDKILIDSYYVTEKYLRRLKEKAIVFYIDDLNKMRYPVDVLINYNIYGPDLDYSAISGKTLLGTAYVPLRKEFSKIENRKFIGIKKILITSGGTDNYNMIGKILSKLLSIETYQDKEYYCVLGRFNKNINYLRNKFKERENVHLLYNITNIGLYMRECDIAITAGGTTTYELCACGIPSIIYTIADNQLEIAQNFSKKGIIPWVGDVREDIDKCLNNIVLEMKKLNEITYWNQKSKNMQALVDGAGAFRIAQEITEYAV